MTDRRRARQKRIGKADDRAAAAADRAVAIARGERCRARIRGVGLCGAPWANPTEYLANRIDVLECTAGHMFRRRKPPIAFDHRTTPPAVPS